MLTSGIFIYAPLLDTTACGLHATWATLECCEVIVVESVDAVRVLCLETVGKQVVLV